jgi:hypothetical protein
LPGAWRVASRVALAVPEENVAHSNACSRTLKTLMKPILVLFAVAAFLSLSCPAYGATAPAQPSTVPGPEKLLPDDTLLVATAPDFNRLRKVFSQSTELQFWNDPAMKAFRDKLILQFQEQFVQPLERELNVSLATYSSLPQGQVTFALTRNGWQGGPGQQLGYLLLIDTKESSGVLKTNLAELKKRWLDSGKQIRTEKIREFEFSFVPMGSNNIPKTLRRFIPRKLEYHELGEEETKPAGGELVIGQAQSLLVVASSASVVEKLAARLSGGTFPCLGEVAGYDASYQRLFRESPLYGWVDIKTLVDGMIREASEKKENPEAPNPVEEAFRAEKVLAVAGFSGLKSAAFSYIPSNEGGLWQFFLAVPESARSGVFKILAGEPKECSPPPFVPSDAVKFQRWRIDGQKAWAALEKMLTDISPQSLTTLNFLLDTANMAAREQDPGFDIRKNLIGNLGDDMIAYEKAPRGTTAADLDNAASVFLLGSANPDQLAASLKNILVFMTAQAGAPAEREFLGRKIFSVPLPAMPVTIPGTAPKPAPARTLHYCGSGGYVAFSTEPAALEEYLRSSESQAKALRETSGLTDAAQRVSGPGTSFFGFENNAELMRATFEVLKNDAGASTNLTMLKLLGSIPGMTKPEQTVRDWMDFSLLPLFDKVAKYFYFNVSANGASAEGLTYRMFSPVPPPLRAAATPNNPK